jgi:hypothetical protein
MDALPLSLPASALPAEPQVGPAAIGESYDDDPWFEALHERLRAEHGPRTALESHLVWRLAMAIWRTERAARLEDRVTRGAWTAAQLQTVMRYQAMQHRETREVLRLLESVRKTSRVLERAAADWAGPSGDTAPVDLDLAGRSAREIVDEIMAILGDDADEPEPAAAPVRRSQPRTESATILPFVRRAPAAAEA